MRGLVFCVSRLQGVPTRPPFAFSKPSVFMIAVAYTYKMDYEAQLQELESEARRLSGRL
jgi:hypothetical protein